MSMSRSHLVYRLLSALAGIVVGVYLVTALGVYAFGWRGPRTTAWTKYVPLPAANVGWHLLSVHAWLVQYQAMTHNSDQLTATSPAAFPPKSASQNAEVAATKIVRDAALASILRGFHLTVSSSDIEQAYQAQLAQTGNSANIPSVIRQLYNWTPEQFKQHVLWTVVARDKLQEHLSYDETLNTSSLRQANAVLDLVKAGKQSFEDIARSYSDDAHGAQGGDMGVVPRGTLVKEVDDAAFSLPLNQVSDLLHSKYGFHIIKVTQRSTDNGQDQAHIFEIFIAAPSVDQYVTARLKEEPVAFWLPGLGWDAHQGQVVAR